FLQAVDLVFGVVDARGVRLEGAVVLGDPLFRLEQGLALLVAEERAAVQLRGTDAPVVVAGAAAVGAGRGGAGVVETVFVAFLVGGLVRGDAVLGAGFAVALVLVAAFPGGAILAALGVPVGAQAVVLVHAGAAGKQGRGKQEGEGSGGAHGSGVWWGLWRGV